MYLIFIFLIKYMALETGIGLWCVAGALVGEIYGPSDGRINGRQ